MADADLSTNHKNNILKKGNPIILEGRTNGSDIKPGHLVTYEGETYPDVDLCASGETPAGFAWKHTNEEDVPDNFDADVAFADNTYIKIISIESEGCELAARMSPKATNGNAIAGGEKLGGSAENLGDGELDVITTLTNAWVGNALWDQSITVGASDNMEVILRTKGGGGLA